MMLHGRRYTERNDGRAEGRRCHQKLDRPPPTKIVTCRLPGRSLTRRPHLGRHHDNDKHHCRDFMNWWTMCWIVMSASQEFFNYCILFLSNMAQLHGFCSSNGNIIYPILPIIGQKLGWRDRYGTI
mmetsp:Transcript_28250/g.64618  ORF Transcript_28250/g.64618 Transcript_28250/m.64618 type:complete len:126 (+) Transcript_28250:362-739(+)